MRTPVRTAIVAFTRQGAEVALRARAVLGGVGLGGADLFYGGNPSGGDPSGGEAPPGWTRLDSGLTEAVGGLFSGYRALVFVSATGIAVRAVAPHLRGKNSDPAVVVIDDLGRFAISLVSGHLGGANRLTELLAAGLGAVPVVTTATDAMGLVAPDLLASEFGWVPDPPNRLRGISAALAGGREVVWYCEPEFLPVLTGRLGPKAVIRSIETIPASLGGPAVLVTPRVVGQAGPGVLNLRPPCLAAGVGCRRAALDRAGMAETALGCLSTADLKAGEPGLVEAARRMGIPLVVVSRSEISQFEGSYSRSEFVRRATGVEGVCEPAAMLTAKTEQLILGKTTFPKFPGVTVALAAAGPETCRLWASARENRVT